MHALYFLADTAALNGENADLFVRAGSLEQAISCWRSYYELAPEAQPERALHVPDVNGPFGAVAWDSIVNL